MDRYRVEGMTCAACSAHVDKAVRKLPFVEDVQVDLLGNAMRVKTRDGKTHEQEIAAAVDHAGYRAVADHPAEASAPVRAPQEPLKLRFLVSLIFLVPLLFISMGPMLGLPVPAFVSMAENPLTNALVQLLLATPGGVRQPCVFQHGHKTAASARAQYGQPYRRWQRRGVCVRHRGVIADVRCAGHAGARACA